MLMTVSVCWTATLDALHTRISVRFRPTEARDTD